MQSFPFVKKSDIKTARNILIRVDFMNFHLFSAYFSDFLNALIKEEKRIILLGSLGDEKTSFRSLQKKVAKTSKLKVKLVKDDLLKENEKIQKKIENLKKKEIILLENINHYPGEKDLNLSLANKLAALADLYIIDSFSFYGANITSISLLPLQIKTVYSDSIKFYTKELDKVYKNLFPHKSTMILGGEVDLLRTNSLSKVISRFDYILLGANWASYFWKKNAGRPSKIRESLEKWAKKYRSKIIFPLDIIVIRKVKGKNEYKAQLIKANEFLNTDIIIDLGPETIRYYALLLRSSQELVYDQLLSPSQDGQWKHSDLILTRAMANRSRGKAYGIILGQALISILEKEDLLSMIDLIVDKSEAFYRFMDTKK